MRYAALALALLLLGTFAPADPENAESIDGATYIRSETAEAPLAHRQATFDDVALTFEDITVRHGSRDLLFALPSSVDERGELHEPAESTGRGGPAHSC